MKETVFPGSAVIFCRVIDNFGDIGICWRLARQLTIDYQMAIYLVVDDVQVLQRIEFAVKPHIASQVVERVRVIGWNAWRCYADLSAVDVVITGFGCALPAEFVGLLAARIVKPIWIDLEYLSAETWVDGFHGMTSPDAFLPITKHFFFPGFSHASGGLLRETGLLAQRERFQNEATIRAFFDEHRIARRQGGANHYYLVVSLFCYSGAPVQCLFSVWENGILPIVCLVPEGVATEAVSAFLGHEALPGASRTRGNLTVEVFALMRQSEYDRLLWACDVNFVRGEDSFVRAQWAGKPVVWQIYPQDEGAHWPKLDAFIDRYTSAAPDDLRRALMDLFHAWNGKGDIASAWKACGDSFGAPASPAWSNHAFKWADGLAQDSDLATRLLQYVRKLS